MKKPAKTFSERLRAWRKRRGFAQTAAAWALSVPIDTYRKWEQGLTEPREAREVEKKLGK